MGNNSLNLPVQFFCVHISVYSAQCYQKARSFLFCISILNSLCIDTPKELTEEEKLQVLHSEEFLSFFERGSRIVERALAEHVDVCFDYSGRDLEDKEG